MPPEDRILWLTWSLCWNNKGNYYWWSEVDNCREDLPVNLGQLKTFLEYRKNNYKKENTFIKHNFKKGDIDKLKEIIFKFELMRKE